MKHSIHINQRQAMDLGIKNLTQGHIFDLLTGASTWATPEVVDGEVYYWVSRQRISDQLPLADLKPDTIYRNLKKLSEIGLIEYIKVGKKDCMRLTKKGQSYYVGSKSEIDENAMSDLNPSNDENSDLNPKKLGSKSEKHSDLDPTYKSINNISPISNKSKESGTPSKKLPAEISETEKSAERVAFYLHERLVEEIPETKRLNPEKWVKEIERAIRIDEIPEGDLIRVIDWMHTGDKFWVANIQSGQKLREKYPTMAGQMRRPKPHQKQHRKPGEFASNRVIEGETL